MRENPAITRLKAVLIGAFDDTAEVSEKEALEAALEVAEGWKMRLDELNDEGE